MILFWFCLILATINELNVIISLLQFSGVLDWIFIYHQRPLLLTKRSPELTICSWNLPKFSSCKFLQLWDSSKYITTCVSVYNLYKFICIFTGQRYFHIKIFLYIFHIKPLIFNTFSKVIPYPIPFRFTSVIKLFLYTVRFLDCEPKSQWKLYDPSNLQSEN